MRTTLRIAAALLVFFASDSAFTQTAFDSLYVTNGTVRAVIVSGGTIYIGGNFTNVGPKTGRGTAIDTATGAPDLAYPRVNGYINAVVPDGSGGWYIGGLFTAVGGTTRNNIAHILADKTVDPDWNPNADDFVRALAVSGSTVYAGGSFTSVGDSSRNRIAALDASTGTATSWDPNANNDVWALAVSGSTVYAGGEFTTIGDSSRNRIAAIDTSTATATSWDPIANNVVWALAVSGSTVYAGGFFTSIGGGQTRNYIAALDASTGSATSWDPNANSDVYALAVSGSTVYAGGEFTSIGGQTRNYIAAIDASTGSPTDWNPNANSTVRALAVSGSTVYAGGDFTTIGGETRNRIAALDASTGSATSWDPNANDRVYALAVSGSTVYAGGDFTSIGGETRNRIAALDASTGSATSWDPNANSTVVALAVSGSTVYAGGYFTSIGGETRNSIAALDASTGSATTWNPNANSTVWALAVSGSTVYAGGDFTTIGDSSRNRIAAIDTSTATATSWDPNANSRVLVLALSGPTVYAGGFFTTVGDSSRNRIAALDASTGSATSWNPNANSTVHALAVSGSTVYAGGEFTSIGGQTRNYIAAIDASTGGATSWNPNANSTVHALAVSGSTVYAGGEFTSIGGQTRNRIAALDASTGSATSWDPNADDAVYTLALDFTHARVYAGGGFTSVLNDVHSYFVGLTNPDDSFTPSPGFSLSSLSLDFGFVHVGTEKVDTLTVMNSDLGTLTIQSVESDSAEFIVAPTGGSIAAGESQKFTVTFSPSSTGLKSGNIVFTHNASSSPDAVAVSGFGRGLGAGYALAFDGNGDYVQVSDDNTLDLTTNYTIEAWIRPSSFNVLAGIVSKWHSTGNSYLLRLTANDPYTGIGFDGMETADSILVANQWYHLAAVNNNGTRTLYVNGTSEALSGNAVTVTANTDPVTIGVDYLPGPRYFNGRIDEVRIWNVARTAAEIRENMHRQMEGTETALVGYWILDEGTGSTASDVTSNSNDGTVQNATWVTSTASLGDGTSNTQTVSGTGNVVFTATDLAADFSAKTGADDFVATLVTSTAPGAQPTGVTTVAPRYWVVRKYGTGTFTANLTFTLGTNAVSAEDQASPSNLKLFKRGSNADTAWAESASAASATDTTVTFSGISSFSQFTIGTTGNSALPIQLAAFTATASRLNAELRWRTETEAENYGFEIERRSVSREYGVSSKEKEGMRVGGNEGMTNQRQDGTTNQRQDETTNQRQDEATSPWAKIGFVPGAGTSTSPKEYSFADKIVTPGRYAYRIKQIDHSGAFAYTDAIELEVGLAPLEFNLAQNYPNPFNPMTTIEFTLPQDGRVVLSVYDLTGREVATLVDEERPAGVYHRVEFDASRLASGMYFSRLRSGGHVVVKKMLLVK
ncbi:MAG: LamG-like jellyroll fold domain-containing protein [Bacteroidota bacterium]